MLCSHHGEITYSIWITCSTEIQHTHDSQPWSWFSAAQPTLSSPLTAATQSVAPLLAIFPFTVLQILSYMSRLRLHIKGQFCKLFSPSGRYLEPDMEKPEMEALTNLSTTTQLKLQIGNRRKPQGKKHHIMPVCDLAKQPVFEAQQFSHGLQRL